MKLSKLNPLNWFKKTSAVLPYLRSEFLKLSLADGKDGFSLADLEIIAEKVKDVNLPNYSSEEKARMVEGWLKARFTNKFAQWAAGKLVQLAYLYAKEKGILK